MRTALIAAGLLALYVSAATPQEEQKCQDANTDVKGKEETFTSCAGVDKAKLCNCTTEWTAYLKSHDIWFFDCAIKSDDERKPILEAMGAAKKFEADNCPCVVSPADIDNRYATVTSCAQADLSKMCECMDRWPIYKSAFDYTKAKCFDNLTQAKKDELENNAVKGDGEFVKCACQKTIDYKDAKEKVFKDCEEPDPEQSCGKCDPFWREFAMSMESLLKVCDKVESAEVLQEAKGKLEESQKMRDQKCPCAKLHLDMKPKIEAFETCAQKGYSKACDCKTQYEALKTVHATIKKDCYPSMPAEETKKMDDGAKKAGDAMKECKGSVLWLLAALLLVL